MNLRDYTATIRGSARRLADGLGVSSAYFSHLVSGYRPVSPARAVRIEELTGGEVTRADLRPDDYWLIWPDLAPPALAVPDLAEKEKRHV